MGLCAPINLKFFEVKSFILFLKYHPLSCMDRNIFSWSRLSVRVPFVSSCRHSPHRIAGRSHLACLRLGPGLRGPSPSGWGSARAPGRPGLDSDPEPSLEPGTGLDTTPPTPGGCIEGWGLSIFTLCILGTFSSIFLRLTRLKCMLWVTFSSQNVIWSQNYTVIAMLPQQTVMQNSWFVSSLKVTSMTLSRVPSSGHTVKTCTLPLDVWVIGLNQRLPDSSWSPSPLRRPLMKTVKKHVFHMVCTVWAWVPFHDPAKWVL